MRGTSRASRAAAASAVAFSLGGCALVDGSVAQGSSTEVLALEPGAVLAQTFRPRSPRIAGVDLLTATYGAAASGTLSVRLEDAGSGALLAEAAVDGVDLRDNGWSSARFAAPVAVPEVALVELTWAGAGAGGGNLGVYANVPPPGSPALRNDPYPGGELVRDDAPAPGDLAFRAVGTGGSAALRTVAARTAALLAGTPLFTLGWLVLLGAAAALALRGLGRPRRGRRAGDLAGPRVADDLGDGGPGEQGHDGDGGGAQDPGELGGEVGRGERELVEGRGQGHVGG